MKAFADRYSKFLSYLFVRKFTIIIYFYNHIFLQWFHRLNNFQEKLLHIFPFPETLDDLHYYVHKSMNECDDITSEAEDCEDE